MSDEDDASKTEEPTSKRIQKSRSEGQVAQSQEVKSLAALLGASIMLMTMLPYVSERIAMSIRPFVEKPHAFAADPANLTDVALALAADITLVLGPILAMFVVIAIAAGLGQFGLLWSPKKLAPKLNKISLISGFKRLFSVRSIMELVKGVIKIAVVAILSYFLVLPFIEDIQLMPGQDLRYTLERIWLIASVVVAGTIGVMLVVAVGDFAYQKYSHLKKLRMTKQEVKDEHKQAEGDPQVKARIRRVRVERARQRMMAAVPEADVVVTNPTHYAVALSYDMTAMTAPRLVAKGVDHLAFRIRNLAEEHDVPIVENPPLARALYASVELEQEIPIEHYKAVAEVIGYVMRLKGKFRQ